MQNTVLWAEDLEGHRQPSLYYLSDEEGADGPHLICDWNGTPTDFCEIEFDSLAVFKEHEPATDTSPTSSDQHVQQKESSDDEFVDYPNPAADITRVTFQGILPKNQPICRRQNDLDYVESAHLDFLSVPPMTAGLIRRFVKHVIEIKNKYTDDKETKKVASI